MVPARSTIIVFAPDGVAFADGVREGERLKMGQPVFKLRWACIGGMGFTAALR